MKNYVVCCNNGRWYEVEAENGQDAEEKQSTISPAEAVEFIFLKEETFWRTKK